jgi:hypothetical protein
VPDRCRDPGEVPEAPANYTEDTGLIARVAVAKAGERLAGVLGQVVR